MPTMSPDANETHVPSPVLPRAGLAPARAARAADGEAEAIDADDLATDVGAGRSAACGIRPTIAVESAIDEALAESEPVAIG